MSDAADAQVDFTIERVIEAGEDRKSDEPEAARNSEKRDPGLEAATDASPPEKAATAMAHEDGFPDRVRRKYYVVADQQAKKAWPSKRASMPTSAANISPSRPRKTGSQRGSPPRK